MVHFDPRIRRVSLDVDRTEPEPTQRTELTAPPTTQVPVETARATHGQKPSSSAIDVRAMPSWNEQLGGSELERTLSAYVEQQRWFGGKARDLVRVAVDQTEPLPAPDGQEMFLAVLRAEYAEGDPERYVALLSAAHGSDAARIARKHPDAVIGTVKDGSSNATLYDAMRTEDGARSLMKLIQEGATMGDVVGSPTRADERVNLAEIPLEVGSKEQSNTSVRIGKEYMLKLLRRMTDGINPDYEVGRFLTESTAFDRVPKMAGAVELADGSTIAMLQSLVKDAADAWDYTLDAIREHLTAVQSGQPEEAEQSKRAFQKIATTLGRRTGELHLALRGEAAAKDPAFAPEPMTQSDLSALAERMRGNLTRVLDVLKAKQNALGDDTKAMAEKLLAGQQDLLRRIDALTAEVPDGAIKTRVHGDYHLGQVLVDHTGEDFMIIDFEGEPTRPLAERRGKVAPEKDVAGMLRSFDYAGRAGLGDQDAKDPAMQAAAREWSQSMQQAFLDGYLAATGAKEASPLLEAYVLDKAIYELDYELNNRTAWAAIPMGALL